MEKHTYTYLLLLGGNLGNVSQTFREAIEQLSLIGTVQKTSALYRSKAWGFEANEMFLNQVVELRTGLLPHNLLSATQNIELQLGRTSKSIGGQYQSRLIDIDILFCGNTIVYTKQLTIPHPLLHKRMFTLVPLAEHWSQWYHPVLNTTVAELIEQCEDKSEVKKES